MSSTLPRDREIGTQRDGAKKTKSTTITPTFLDVAAAAADVRRRRLSISIYTIPFLRNFRLVLLTTP